MWQIPAHRSRGRGSSGGSGSRDNHRGAGPLLPRYICPDPPHRRQAVSTIGVGYVARAKIIGDCQSQPAGVRLYREPMVVGRCVRQKRAANGSSARFPQVPEPEPVAVAASAVASQNGTLHISSAHGPAPAPVAAQPVRIQAAAEETPDPISPDLPSRLSGFKERFLWLGRKNRGE